MSSCIAVACEMSRCLVTVSDRKWTELYSSFQESLKACHLAHGWLALIAGDNVARAGERVVHEIRDTLKDQDPGTISATQMAEVLDKAWNVVQNKIATTAVLGALGLSMPEFMRSLEKFGDEKFGEMLAEIQDKRKLGLELLVCGFDDSGVPIILVRGDSLDAAYDMSRVGRAAIGSGDLHAQASLAAHRFESTLSLNAAIYHACTAKFASEQSEGVGDQTIVICMRQDGSRCLLAGTEIKWIRGLWERETKPKLPAPEKIHELIDPIVKKQWGNL
jgi:hypothetical protein